MGAHRRLRVVTLIDVPSAAGGAEGVAMEIAVRLDRERFTSTVCASRFDGRPRDDGERVGAETLAAAGVPLIGLGRSRKLEMRAWRPFLSMLRRERVDVLHAHMFGSNFWGTVLGRAARVPVVVAHEHGWGRDTAQPLRRFVDRDIIGRASDAFIAVSGATRARMIEVAGVRPQDIVLIPNGIRPRAGGARDLRRELGVPDGSPVIGTVAVLRPEKAVDILIQAAAVLRERHAGLRVLIAGQGTEHPKLEALIRALGLDTTVSLLGFRTDVPDVLAALDVVAFSSTSEGSPLSIMEAMEAGKPIVATAVGGVPDLIDDGVHGLLVQPGDPSALAAGISRLLDDREAASAMALRARERRRDEFDAGIMVGRMERLYEDLYARSRRGRSER